MKVYELPAETKAATGFTHKAVIDHTDLTETTADTDQTIELLAVAAGDFVEKAAFKLVTTFEDSDDTNLNDTQVSIGDGADPDRFITATQVNENGTEVYYKTSVPTVPYAYTAADTIDILVESMSAKSLSDIDAGELNVFLSIQKVSAL